MGFFKNTELTMPLIGDFADSDFSIRQAVVQALGDVFQAYKEATNINQIVFAVPPDGPWFHFARTAFKGEILACFPSLTAALPAKLRHGCFLSLPALYFPSGPPQNWTLGASVRSAMVHVPHTHRPCAQSRWSSLTARTPCK
jgi:hypothetical protein